MTAGLCRSEYVRVTLQDDQAGTRPCRTITSFSRSRSGLPGTFTSAAISFEVASANGARRQHDQGAGGLGLWVLVVVGAAAGDEDGIARPDQLHLAIDSRG